MSIRGKRILSTITYYTLAILAILMTAFFIYALVVKDVAMWAKTIYFIWSGFLIANVIFDIICTRSENGKFITGLITYILSILAVVMACILYFFNTGVAGLATEFFNLFLSVSIISLMSAGYMIATWCVGQSLIERKTSEHSINKNK